MARRACDGHAIGVLICSAMVQEEEARESQPALVTSLRQDAVRAARYLVFDPEANRLVMPVLLLMESMALKIIIGKVPYTEIDYKAYMEQVEMIEYDHVLDYSLIRGSTGPLVYPAGHVWIYRLLHWLTRGMEDLRMGQHAFRYLYMATLLVQMVCYYQLNLPPWRVVFACLSKRLHSIYVLRLFNDCFATFFVVCTVTLFTIVSQSRSLSRSIQLTLSILASILYSIAVSIKMNALLYLPSVLVSLFLITTGNMYTLGISCLLMISWQLIVALPFLQAYPREYIHGAFDFSRKFMYKWSVNWQILEEDAFNNEVFHVTLLLAHILCMLTVIIAKYPSICQHLYQFSWVRPLQHIQTIRQEHLQAIPFMLITTNFVGVLFSRSLHYQFLSWYHWTLPILLDWSGMPWIASLIWYALHEHCWNSYPPNSLASALLLVLNIELLLAIFWRQLCNAPPPPPQEKKNR